MMDTEGMEEMEETSALLCKPGNGVNNGTGSSGTLKKGTNRNEKEGFLKH